ncbi:MAG: hypothetical protein BRC40_02830 [Cyanobacteria bacterium QH_8_48_120]|jgi:hypothetical protein|nr:MAG: hypothetical protein BRC34_01980 [Cyanobacteria bacterium QH_1_48_107]PSO60810.1 MAG: hypothetical protein BRC35_00970 [Cyanobacteria bacterium QH_10_48_56]PSO62009.1 MAG: hypothetical protein BRC38_16855 [Cyanobacteria bacterium QH_6_48_35]PSO63263.1 MAG: hypothetical protein BRC39_04815 [Cyanobacteria bacterium QH_7_48_89]PSO71564.1 MAG: hypothetical protein BRC42_07690 [Cyanobacteria bacterium QS_1_48_34]PSO71849.1 MAG: hypothetical protein BRC37_12965 [Cyanobacteria bacterium QH_3_
MKERFLNWLDRLLIADFFLVLLSFFWFAIAVIGRSVEIPLGFNLWYQLWQPVFTPAIGILILGAVASGVARQISKRFGSGS